MAEVQIIQPSIDSNHIVNINKKTKKKKVCAYCRVSTDMDDQRTSYLSQISHYSDYIKNNKSWEFVGIYADDGITGTQIKKRNEFIRMIDDCKSGMIDIILAKSISRFARNTVDTLNTVRMLRELDIDVYFEKENIHTLTMDSEMFLTLYSAFAQAESESTSQNVKLGYKAKMKRGEPCGSISCYGYDWDRNSKELCINEKHAKVVKKIFEYYLSGDGSTVIARKLTEEGIPAPAGGKIWHSSVIKDILRNVKYVGDLCGQKYFVENPISHKLLRNRGQKPMYYVSNHHKGIIDRASFEKVQEIYTSRSKTIKNGKEYCEKFSLRYTFSSMVFCEHCGKTFVRRTSKYKNKDGVVHNHIYWACSNIVSNKEGSCGKAVTIRDEELKSLFVAIFNKFLNQSKNDDLIKKIKNVISNDNSEEKLKAIFRKIDNVKERMRKLIDLNINNDLNDDVFNEKNQELNKELIDLENEKRNIMNSKVYIQNEEKRLRDIEKELNKSSTIHRFDDEVFKKLISKVIMGEYEEDGTYNPSVVKFVLNLKNISSSDDTNSTKFLSLEIDERNNKSKGVQLMTKLNEIELDSIKGGTNVTGPVINAIVNVIKILQDAGYSLGSGIRRIAENNLCPLK